MNTLAKCSVCGRITNEFFQWGSLHLADQYPRECVYVCGPDCMDDATSKIDKGKWKLPTLRKSCGGYAHDISKPRKGYDAQPTQAELIKALLPQKP